VRYLPLTADDRAAMLAAIGVGGIDDLYRDVPREARLEGPIADLPPHRGEQEVERAIRSMTARNIGADKAAFFVGCGLYRHHVPASVDHLIQRGEFLTSYTPYQPEIAQGTLQVLFEFQTMVARITGMDVANASMYDGATSTADAMLMATRVTRRNRVVVAGGLHPHYADTLATYARFNAIDIHRDAPEPARGDDLEALADGVDGDTACVIVQNPDVFGHIRDLTPLAKRCREQGALLVAVVTEAVSLGAIRPPGAMGADIVTGEGQSIGVPLNFGGPTVGLFATRDRLVRQMPGRLAGETVDADGRRGYVLTLAAREQHIRRERATSNICTNSGLCALAFTIHLSLLGEDGFRRLAALNHARTVQLAERLAAIDGVRVLNRSFFNEIVVELPTDAAAVVDELVDHGVLAGVPLMRLYPGEERFARLLLVACTETNTEADIAAFVHALQEVVR
jgi:glycine dehydrogenase subunit 1